MLAILDILYQVLASPSTAFQVVSTKRPLRWGIATAFFSSVVFAFVLLPCPPRLIEAIFGLDRGTLNAAPLVLVWLSLFPLALLVQAALLHLVASMMRGKGSYLGMFCGLCFASFPLIFFAPLALLRALVDSRHIQKQLPLSRPHPLFRRGLGTFCLGSVALRYCRAPELPVPLGEGTHRLLGSLFLDHCGSSAGCHHLDGILRFTALLVCIPGLT